MDVLNMNAFPVTPRIKDGAGGIDYAHVAAKRRVALPPGFTVDPSWLADQENVFTYANSESKTALSLAAAPKGRVAQEPVRVSVRAPAPTAPAPSPAPVAAPTSAPSADSSDANATK